MQAAQLPHHCVRDELTRVADVCTFEEKFRSLLEVLLGVGGHHERTLSRQQCLVVQGTELGTESRSVNCIHHQHHQSHLDIFWSDLPVKRPILPYLRISHYWQSCPAVSKSFGPNTLWHQSTLTVTAVLIQYDQTFSQTVADALGCEGTKAGSKLVQDAGSLKHPYWRVITLSSVTSSPYLSSETEKSSSDSLDDMGQPKLFHRANNRVQLTRRWARQL